MSEPFDYILQAQKYLNSGNAEACREILVRLKESKVGHMAMIERAFRNFYKGKKKLLAVSSPCCENTSPRKAKAKPAKPVQLLPSKPLLYQEGSFQSAPCQETAPEQRLSNQASSQSMPCKRDPLQPLICKQMDSNGILLQDASSEPRYMEEAHQNRAYQDTISQVVLSSKLMPMENELMPPKQTVSKQNASQSIQSQQVSHQQISSQQLATQVTPSRKLASQETSSHPVSTQPNPLRQHPALATPSHPAPAASMPFQQLAPKATPSHPMPAASMPFQHQQSKATPSHQMLSQSMPSQHLAPKATPSHPTPAGSMSLHQLASTSTPSLQMSFQPITSQQLVASKETPSQHQTTQPTPSQPTTNTRKRKPVYKKRTLKLGLPTRVITQTPKSEAKPKICIRKLEESPMDLNEETLPSTEINTIPKLLSKSLFADDKFVSKWSPVTAAEAKSSGGVGENHNSWKQTGNKMSDESLEMSSGHLKPDDADSQVYNRNNFTSNLSKDQDSTLDGIHQTFNKTNKEDSSQMLSGLLKPDDTDSHVYNRHGLASNRSKDQDSILDGIHQILYNTNKEASCQLSGLLKSDNPDSVVYDRHDPAPNRSKDQDSILDGINQIFNKTDKEGSCQLSGLLTSADALQGRGHTLTDPFNKIIFDDSATSYTLECLSQTHHNISKEVTGVSGVMNTSNNSISMRKHSSNIESANCGLEKKALRSLSSIFESDDNQKDLSGSADRKRCGSDSGFQDVNSGGDYQTPFKVMNQIKGSDSGLGRSATGPKINPDTAGAINQDAATKPDTIKKSIEDDLSHCYEPVAAEKENLVYPPQPSFKMPTAPAPKSQTDNHHVPVSVKYVSQQPEPAPSNAGKSIGDLAPKVQDKELSALIMQRRDAASRIGRGACSTTKKNKMYRIKSEMYRVISLLGKGGSSKVYEVEKEDGRRFALKCVWLEDLDDTMYEAHFNEIRILQALAGKPNIIRLHEWEKKNEILHMLMEKGDRDLDRYLHLNKKLDNDQIRMLWKQMLLAVDTIHKQGIIHTDLKPANFLFVEFPVLKLIDFGIAKGLQENCTSTQRDCRIGTLNYMAPEAVSEAAEGRVEEGKKNFKIRRATDIWSLGCILYLMVYGKTPFQHITHSLLKIHEITNGKAISFPEIEDSELLDSIKGCLKRKPSDRYSIEQLLNHPFLTGHPVGC